MAGNIRIGAGVETPAQSRTSVSGGFRLPAQPAPAPAPAGYQLAYRMGGPYYMYGETPRYGAYYRDGGIVPGQIYGSMRGSREGADMFGFWPTMFQSQPYATASQMYTPGLGVMPLIGYPSKYPHVVMGGYSDYGAGIANQAMGMMLPLLMMGLYRQMFPMPGAAPAPAAKGASGGGGRSGGSGGGSSQKPAQAPAPADSGGAAMDYSAVDGMPIKPSPDSVYHVHDTGWKPGAAPAADAAKSDPWVDRALRIGMVTPALQPFAAAASAMRGAPAVARFAKDHPVAARAALGALPGMGPSMSAGAGLAPFAGNYFLGK